MASSAIVQSRVDALRITSPKRVQKKNVGWERFFPYYAGFPFRFAESILTSAKLGSSAVVLDPWNGSGTTTEAAGKNGLNAIGVDINPVMTILSKSRLLCATEADSIEPLAREVCYKAKFKRFNPLSFEPLSAWFDELTCNQIRSLESAIRLLLLGELTVGVDGVNVSNISGLASTFYVALFSICRDFVASFRCSNPTWIRSASHNSEKVSVSRKILHEEFCKKLKSITEELATSGFSFKERSVAKLMLADSTKRVCVNDSVDFVLTSPPYCTRIDYTSATKVELAIIAPLLTLAVPELSRKMIGSVRVPAAPIAVNRDWGSTCLSFLEKVQSHNSKASAGYYLKTHLDYFEKMQKAIVLIGDYLKEDGIAILVVQDSRYKEIHNNVPQIISEMGVCVGLSVRRTDNFQPPASMSRINPHSRSYSKHSSPIETVICFSKS